MEKISLDEAIRQIKRICDQHQSLHQQRQHPFFFIIGAGVSFPSIPLASEIIEDCKKKVPDIKELVPKDPIDQYSFWIEKAYPSQESRRIYFAELITNKPITHAHLRLAHLLSKKKVANIIVTPNFDDLLSRALWLFEMHHVTCDHPRTVERIDPGRNDIQVIHVHGNYLFYDIKNLKPEVEERASFSEYDISMLEKISSIMSQFSPIIIGYSGWENDIIMTALKRSLDEAVKNNIYWFCYREEDCNSLPEFIKNNHYVKCVVPPKSEIKKQLALEVDRLDSSSNIPFQKEQIKNITQVPPLTAQQVFDAFNMGFECGVPELTEDPFSFIIKKLEHASPSLFSVSDSSYMDERDLYSINMVIQRISQAKKCLENQILGSEKGLTLILDAVRKSDYAAALKIPDELDLSILNEKQLDSFINAVTNALLNLNIPSLEQLSLLDDFIRRLNVSSIENLNEAISLALIQKARAVRECDRPEEAVAAYDQVITRFGELESPELQVQVAEALFNKGWVLGELKRPEEAVAAYDQVIDRFGQSESPELQIYVARALFNKGWVLGELKRPEEAVATYDQVITRFGELESPELQVQVAGAFVNKGVALGKLKRPEEAVAAYDQVIDRFGQSESFILQERVARALFNKGVALGELKRPEEAVATYDQVITRFGQSESPELQIEVAKAFINKGVVLGELKRPEEAVAAYDQVIDRFGQSESPDLQIYVARALFNKGVALGKLKRPEEAVATYDQVITRFGQSESPELQIAVAGAFVYKGDIFEKMGNNKEAMIIYSEILKKFRKSKDKTIRGFLKIIKQKMKK